MIQKRDGGVEEMSTDHLLLNASFTKVPVVLEVRKGSTAHPGVDHLGPGPMTN